MTPPQFTIQDGYLKELPRMEMPELPTDVADKPYPKLKAKLKEYEKHIASLRRYRINPSDWDNVPMPIGEDGFEVVTGQGEAYAIPTQPAKGQEERTFTLREIIDAYTCGWMDSDKPIAEARSKYLQSLTPKPQ